MFFKIHYREAICRKQNKNFQIGPSELIDESSGISESDAEQATQNEPGTEPSGAVTK